MQHPTITVEHGNLKINDEKVFSLWLRLNEMAADDPVAAWAVAEIRMQAFLAGDAPRKSQEIARLRNELLGFRDAESLRVFGDELRALVLKHSEVLRVSDDSEF